MKEKTSGFTLIELIIVIVILGILAVVALPRFVNVSDDARSSSVRYMAGTLQQTIDMARSKWFIEGKPPHIDVGGIMYGMNPDFGYPECIGLTGFCEPSMLGNRTAGDECAVLWNTILIDAPKASIDQAACLADEECGFLVTPLFGFNFCDFTDQKGNGDNVILWNIEEPGKRGKIEFNP